MSRQKGDSRRFDRAWRELKKKRANWFYKEEPENQIQYAFGQHFDFLRSVVPVRKKDKCLEVGCGRGSFGAFFANYGCRVTLTDLSSEIVKETRKIFRSLGLDGRCEFCVADVLDLEFQEGTYDLTTSIGLLEHFKDPTEAMKNQVRVLKKGGVFTAYVVPEKWTMTKVFEPVNNALNDLVPASMRDSKKRSKPPLYRTDYDSAYYKRIMKKLGLKKIGSAGVYPYPAISYSTAFPFSLMPPRFEKALVSALKDMEKMRRKANKGQHPWVCDESIAQGFFIWGIK